MERRGDNEQTGGMGGLVYGYLLAPFNQTNETDQKTK